MEDRRRRDMGVVLLRSEAEPGLLRLGQSFDVEPVQRPGDNRWSMSIWARDLDTGKVKWIYQMTPHDEWDFDGVNEMILTDQEVGGKMRGLLTHFDRNGFGYTLDRATGELLVAEKFDPVVNWATKVDRTSRPRPMAARWSSTPIRPSTRARTPTRRASCPAALGTKDEQPAAYSPDTQLFYVPTNHVCMDYEPYKVAYTAGQAYVGAAVAMYPA